MASSMSEPSSPVEPQTNSTDLRDASPGDRLSRGFERVGAWEWFMLVLAALHVFVFSGAAAYERFLPSFVVDHMAFVDLGLVALYGLEFAVRVARAERRLMFVKTHWYDLMGILPLGSSYRAFRLVRGIRMFVVLRLEWWEDVDWHRAFVRGVILRFRDILLEEITQPILVRGIRMAQVPLRKAKLPSVVGVALDTQRKNVAKLALASMKFNKGLKPIANTDLGEKVVTIVTDHVMDSVVQTLKSDEFNDLIYDTVEDVLEAAIENLSDGAKAVTGGDGGAATSGAPSTTPTPSI